MTHLETDDIVAFAALNQQTCILSQIFVSSDWKRQGLGTQILKWVEQQCPNGFSLTAAADNHEAIAFYKKYGLIVIGYSTNDFNGKPEVGFWQGPI